MTRSNCASAYAILPLSENVFSLKGSPTLSRPARSSVGLKSLPCRRVIACSMAALRSGVSRRSPSGAAKTTLSTPPCSDANSDSIRSVAFCVSDPGISNSSLRLPPTVPTRTISRTTIPSQPRTTRQGCDAHARDHLASEPVERRSWAASRPSTPFSSCPTVCSVMRPFLPAFPRSSQAFSLIWRAQYGRPVSGGYGHPHLDVDFLCRSFDRSGWRNSSLTPHGPTGRLKRAGRPRPARRGRRPSPTRSSSRHARAPTRRGRSGTCARRCHGSTAPGQPSPRPAAAGSRAGRGRPGRQHAVAQRNEGGVALRVAEVGERGEHPVRAEPLGVGPGLLRRVAVEEAADPG